MDLNRYILENTYLELSETKTPSLDKIGKIKLDSQDGEITCFKIVIYSELVQKVEVIADEIVSLEKKKRVFPSRPNFFSYTVGIDEHPKYLLLHIEDSLVDPIYFPIEII